METREQVNRSPVSDAILEKTDERHPLVQDTLVEVLLAFIALTANLCVLVQCLESVALPLKSSSWPEFFTRQRPQYTPNSCFDMAWLCKEVVSVVLKPS